jgi:hypothetical protein
LGHYIVISIVLGETGQMTEPEAATTNPRPALCWGVYMCFLIHTPKGRYKCLLFISQRSVQFGPLHSNFYSSRRNRTNNGTRGCNNQTNTNNPLGSLNVFPNAFSLLELEIKHKHGGFNINYEKATVVWQQFGFGS